MKNCYNCYISSNKTLHNRKAVILLSFKSWVEELSLASAD